MVQTQTVCCTGPTIRPQKTRTLWRPKKKVKKPVKPAEKVIPQIRPISVCAPILPEVKEEVRVTETDDGKRESKQEREVISLVESIKMKILEERLAKEKQAEEDRAQFVKEAAARKAAEREAVINQAKKMILYRKPFCRRINQGLLLSECLRELDAQLKFREHLRNVDKTQEEGFVNLMREDVAKYEEETRQKAEKQKEIKTKYTAELKKQIEENRSAAMRNEKEEFEAGRQDQVNMKKRLEEMNQYEAQQLKSKKEKLKQFFTDAIEEKKQSDLELRNEEKFEDRANEIYQEAATRIKKIQKSIFQKEKEGRLEKAKKMAELYITYMKSPTDLEEKIYQKAIQEQEEEYREKQRIKKEREDRMRKELSDYRAQVKAGKLKQLEEEKDFKTWEKIQIFKKVECDEEWEAEERKRLWNEKVECGKMLKKYMGEKEVRDNLEKLDEDRAAELEKKIMEKENQKILNYAEEVIKESEGVRPLYPILKAVEACKKEMGVIPPKVLKCGKLVAEDKILYLS